MTSSSTALQDRLNTLAGIWIQAQNLKKELEELARIEKASASMTNEERAIAKIVEYSMVYDVPAKDLYAIVKCESQFNPNARNLSEKEDSWSWVQINRKAHPHISVSQAKDLDFAIPFLAKNWSEGRKWMWKNCAERHNLI
jgi:soluble lytic murein transglycosylase-like protein